MPNYKLAAARAAKKYGINEQVFLNQINAESNFNPRAGSSAGAKGIAQFMPATAKQYHVNLGDGRVTDDLEGAARYMRDALRRSGGDYKKALSIYNSGRPDGYLHIPETKAYVAKIMGGTKIGVSGDTGKAGATTSTRTINTPADDSDQQNAIIDALLSNKKDPLSFAASLPVTPASSKTVTTKTPGTPASAAKEASGPKHAGLLELFWQGKGGINAKNGVKVPQGFVSGHTDHVHVAAANQATIIHLGWVAETKFGLHVGEQPHFGKVHQVHVANSNHYKDLAIDVSGDPAQMAAFAHFVAGSYGIK